MSLSLYTPNSTVMFHTGCESTVRRWAEKCEACGEKIRSVKLVPRSIYREVKDFTVTEIEDRYFTFRFSLVKHRINWKRVKSEWEHEYEKQGPRVWEVKFSIDDGVSLTCDGRPRKNNARNFLEVTSADGFPFKRYAPDYLCAYITKEYQKSKNLNKNDIPLICQYVYADQATTYWHYRDSGPEEFHRLFNRPSCTEELLVAGFSPDKINILQKVLKTWGEGKDSGPLHKRLSITRTGLRLLRQIDYAYLESFLRMLVKMQEDEALPNSLAEKLFHLYFYYKENEQLDTMRIVWSNNFVSLLGFGYYRNIEKLLQYVVEDVRQYQGIKNPAEAVQLLLDYVRTCHLMDEKPEKYPRSLKLRHDVASFRYSQVKDELLNKNVEKACASYTKDETDVDNYCIVVPKSGEDLDNEHAHLNHCIHTYKEKVANKKTKIYFLRKRESKETPLVTVEVANGVIVQARGESNRITTREEKRVLDAWAHTMNYQREYS